MKIGKCGGDPLVVDKSLQDVCPEPRWAPPRRGLRPGGASGSKDKFLI